jgi:hypothetical protein
VPNSKKSPKRRKEMVKARVPEGDAPEDADAARILASLARVRDPMIRYLINMLVINMLVDRLTQAIVEIERGGAQTEKVLEEIMDTKRKLN